MRKLIILSVVLMVFIQVANAKENKFENAVEAAFGFNGETPKTFVNGADSDGGKIARGLEIVGIYASATGGLVFGGIVIYNKYNYGTWLKPGNSFFGCCGNKGTENLLEEQGRELEHMKNLIPPDVLGGNLYGGMTIEPLHSVKLVERYNQSSDGSSSEEKPDKPPVRTQEYLDLRARADDYFRNKRALSNKFNYSQKDLRELKETKIADEKAANKILREQHENEIKEIKKSVEQKRVEAEHIKDLNSKIEVQAKLMSEYYDGRLSKLKDIGIQASKLSKLRQECMKDKALSNVFDNIIDGDQPFLTGITLSDDPLYIIKNLKSTFEKKWNTDIGNYQTSLKEYNNLVEKYNIIDDPALLHDRGILEGVRDSNSFGNLLSKIKAINENTDTINSITDGLKPANQVSVYTDNAETLNNLSLLKTSISNMTHMKEWDVTDDYFIGLLGDRNISLEKPPNDLLVTLAANDPKATELDKALNLDVARLNAPDKLVVDFINNYYKEPVPVERKEEQIKNEVNNDRSASFENPADSSVNAQEDSSNKEISAKVEKEVGTFAGDPKVAKDKMKNEVEDKPSEVSDPEPVDLKVEVLDPSIEGI